MTKAKYPMAQMSIMTYKYIIDKLRAKAEKKGIKKFGTFMTEWLETALENEKRIAFLDCDDLIKKDT